MTKTKPYRSEKYLSFVRSRPCVYCMSKNTQAHHIRGVGHLGGMGLKAPDWAAYPVCPVCHEEVQKDPSLWPDQFEWALKTVGEAIQEGFFK
jgi:hypothetical protein